MKEFIKKVVSHNLARGSAVVFAGSMVGNVAGYLYHLILGRLLGPIDYGELSSLFSLLYIGTAPLVVAQTVIIKFVAGFKAHGQEGQTKSFLLKLTKATALAGMVGFPVAFFAAPLISSFLHLSSHSFFVLTYALFALSLLMTITGSVIQGYQKFVAFSILSAGLMVTKVLLSIPMVAWGIEGVLWAALLATLLIYALDFVPLRSLLIVKAKPAPLNKKEMFRFAAPTFFTLLGVTSLYSTDVVLVRHFLAASDAGLYAALAVLGKVIFFASSSVSLVLFPVLSERTARGEATKKLVMVALGGVSLLSLAITAVYFAVPDLVVHMLFGNAYQGASALLGQLGIFLTLFSIGNLLVMTCLALGKTGVWVIGVVCALLQIAGIVMFHENIAQVITVNIGVCGLLVAGALGYYFKVSYEKV